MANASLTVVLVHKNDVERVQIRQALETIPGVQIAGERPDLRAGMALAHQVRPVILVLEVTAGGDDALSAAAQYRLEDPHVTVFAAVDSVNPELLMRAMRAGVQEILKRPFDRAALTAAIERVAQLHHRKQGGGVQRSVITVFSNKGGVGVTMVATNLALSLKRVTIHQVALIDFDYQSGDVASMTGVEPARSMGDLLNVDRMDSTSVQSVMSKHPTGVMVLPQPEMIDQADGMTAHQAGSILEVVSSTHEIVVVDSPHVFNEITLEIFDRSSAILLVVEASVPSVRAARRSLELFQKLNYLAVADRVRILVNRRTEKSVISAAQMEETLGMPISFNIANDYAAVSESINLGRPLCADTPASRAGRDIDAIAKALVAVDGEAPAESATPRRRLRLFGRG